MLHALLWDIQEAGVFQGLLAGIVVLYEQENISMTYTLQESVKLSVSGLID